MESAASLPRFVSLARTFSLVPLSGETVVPENSNKLEMRGVLWIDSHIWIVLSFGDIGLL